LLLAQNPQLGPAATLRRRLRGSLTAPTPLQQQKILPADATGVKSMLVAGGIGGLRLPQERMSTNYRGEMEMRLTLELSTFPQKRHQ
jgi:hypothetical protein